VTLSGTFASDATSWMNWSSIGRAFSTSRRKASGPRSGWRTKSSGSTPAGSRAMRASTMPASTNSGIAFCPARWPAASPSNTTTTVFASRPSTPICSSGQRRPHRRHRLLDPGLVQREDVEVPLDDDRGAGPPDGVERGVQAVERLLLVEQRRLGRVDVLAVLDLGIQHAAAEADHALLPIDHRQHHAVAEKVVAAALVDADEAQRSRSDAGIFCAARCDDSPSQRAGA
jgi:hypothetical protein